jgi:hypothetical protein
MSTIGSLRRNVSYTQRDAAELRAVIHRLLERHGIDIPTVFQEVQLDGLFADAEGDRPMDVKALRDFVRYEERWRLLGDQGAYEKLKTWLVDYGDRRS